MLQPAYRKKLRNQNPIYNRKQKELLPLMYYSINNIVSYLKPYIFHLKKSLLLIITIVAVTTITNSSSGYTIFLQIDTPIVNMLLLST